jgi:magnesium chelatase subunit D
MAFRGRGATLLLPPTRSLVRAKRSLAALPGGGGTPLASGIDAAFALADAVKRRGQTPVVIILTDGQANVSRDGVGGRAKAGEDALQAAKQARLAGVAALLIDSAPRPQAQARAIAAELGARYLALPYANASLLSAAVRSTGIG